MDGQGMGQSGHRDTGLEAIAIVQIRTRVEVVEVDRKCWFWDTHPELRITMSEHTSHSTSPHGLLSFAV